MEGHNCQHAFFLSSKKVTYNREISSSCQPATYPQQPLAKQLASEEQSANQPQSMQLLSQHSGAQLGSLGQLGEYEKEEHEAHGSDGRVGLGPGA
jgi:hypothetical protein